MLPRPRLLEAGADIGLSNMPENIAADFDTVLRETVQLHKNVAVVEKTLVPAAFREACESIFTMQTSKAAQNVKAFFTSPGRHLSSLPL